MSDKGKKSRETKPETAANSSGADKESQAEARNAQEAQGDNNPCEEEAEAKAPAESLKCGDADSANATQDANVSDEECTPESRIEALEKLCAEYKDLYLRKAADFDNYRKRMIKEKQEAIDFANTTLLVDLIQILDDFDRAISAAGTAEEGSPEAAFIEGILMIRRQMASMLENKYGLMYYPSPAGEPFDPNIHEAIGRVSSEEVAEAVVQEECRKGYKLKDRVIRLAQVIVKTPPED